MGMRVIYDADESRAVLYNSTVEMAFPVVFLDSKKLDAREQAEMFLDYLLKRQPIMQGASPMTDGVNSILMTCYVDFVRDLPSLIAEKELQEEE